jgi:hypothetical protein
MAHPNISDWTAIEEFLLGETPKNASITSLPTAKAKERFLVFDKGYNEPLSHHITHCHFIDLQHSRSTVL